MLLRLVGATTCLMNPLHHEISSQVEERADTSASAQGFAQAHQATQPHQATQSHQATQADREEPAVKAASRLETESSSKTRQSGRRSGKRLIGGLLVLGGITVLLLARGSDPLDPSRSCESPEGTQFDCQVNEPVPEAETGWVMPIFKSSLWAEEFDQVDPSIWEVEHSTFGDGNNELQCYTPDQVSTRDGKLVLKAEIKSTVCPNGDRRRHTSGMLRTSELTLSPGQAIEWRVKLTPNSDTNQAGLWPAVWASSWAGGSWPTGGEWDGFEVMTANSPDRVSFGIHYEDVSGDHAKTVREVYGDRFSDASHDFRFDYGDDGTLVWYMDGVVTHRVTNAPTKQGYPAPFDQTMTELRINLALGGNPGALDDRALPATLEVDYIRAWSI